MIPTWLMWVGGGLLTVIAIWCLAWMALFAFLGKSFYQAFKGISAGFVR